MRMLWVRDLDLDPLFDSQHRGFLRGKHLLLDADLVHLAAGSLSMIKFRTYGIRQEIWFSWWRVCFCTRSGG